MADNNGSNIVAIFAILIIVLVAAAVVYYVFMSGKVESNTIVTQPTKVIETSTSNQ